MSSQLVDFQSLPVFSGWKCVFFFPYGEDQSLSLRIWLHAPPFGPMERDVVSCLVSNPVSDLTRPLLLVDEMSPNMISPSVKMCSCVGACDFHDLALWL